jgi:PEGA domain
VTTSSGKPPFDEQPLDPGWDAGDLTGGPDSSSLEPPTQRQPAVHRKAPAADDAAPVYGAGVPYGGDDRTEEIDPIALDMPFALDQRKTPPAPAPVPAPATPRAPAPAPRRDYEMAIPVKQLLLSDLFDSTPSSGAMDPPDPAAFTSNRPAPPERAPVTPAVIALPSIDVGSSPRAARVEPQAPVRAAMPTPVLLQLPARPPLATPIAPAAAAAPVAATVSVEEGPKQRRSAPTAESIDSTASGPGSAPAVTPKVSPVGSSPSHSSPSHSSPLHSSPLHSSPLHSRPSDSLPLATQPVEPQPPVASPSTVSMAPLSDAPTLDEVVRLPSEIATSRPPDVVLNPASLNVKAEDFKPEMRTGVSGSDASARLEPRAPRESIPARATVAAPVTSQAAKAQLPSIMLAADVEAELDSSARRALRATRATVRLELPPTFGRPGSPVGSPPTSFGPGAASAHGTVGQASEPELPWFANPQTRRLIGFALAGLLLVVALVFALSPRSGSLVVTALAPGNRAADDVTIFIDGKPLCDVSPCRIKGLSPGMHTLRASAPNLASQAEETVEISAGDEATYNIDLLAVAPELRGGGMRVSAGETPLTLYVDGKRVGRLPQEVSGLSSGKHWIKLDPEDGSPPIEKSVNVLAGETVEVEPKAAKRDKALVTIRLSRGSEGALVTFDDAFLLDFPAELELEPGTTHSLSATKPGFEDLSMEVELGANETEKLIELSLTPAEGSAPARKARAKAARKLNAAKATAPASTPVADTTQGLLNISSVPPSQIILNGRPLGSTPKTGITVPGDSLQTIVFVHPKMGRRRAQKFVPAGKERTVSIRF